MLEAARAYASGDPALDYRARALGNLVLAMAFSAGLHAALLSLLERLPVQRANVPLYPRLSVQIREQPEPPAPRAAAAAGAPARQPASAAQPSIPSVLPERYFTAREVDTPARPSVTVPLIYPEAALIWKLRGVVRLRLFINERGTVDSVHLVRADPPGEFEDAALTAARRLIYEPALKNGRAVKSQKLIEVTFDPYEAPPPRR